MLVIDCGHGPPLVLVPGLQGRWEWMRPAVDALAASCRVLTFQLSGERHAGRRLDGSYGIDAEVERMVRLLEDRQIDRAAICGISFGGLIALRFAAVHPERTARLILASTPGPGFRLSRRHARYLKAPKLFGPLFLLQSPQRLGREIRAALPGWDERMRFVSWQASRLLVAPLSPTRMARRAAVIVNNDPAADAKKVSAPTLVVTGEAGLDYVVPTAGTSKYLELIPHSRSIVLARTGHLGSITRPHVFARVVHEFLAGLGSDPGLTPCAQGRAS
jgi:pimeloyl-ACP methyl ester carboxylesterase